MTAQQLPPPIGEVSASTAAALLASQSPPVLLDSRPSSSHKLEHIAGALSNPPAHLLSGKTVLVYDAGAPSLCYASSLSVAAITKYASAKGNLAPEQLLLIKGGLPAVREAAPHLVRLGTRFGELRRRVRGMRWAMRVLERVEWEAAPPGRVFDWLWVGAEPHAGEQAALANAGFTHVVVAGGELKVRFPSTFCYFMVAARDVVGYDIKKHFLPVIRFLEGVRGRVERRMGARCLVHCFAGASRSVSLIMAYLIWKGMSVDQALERVKNGRKAADPNEGFLRQLREWECEVREGRLAPLKPDTLATQMPGEQAQDRQQNDHDDEDDEDEGASLVVEERLETPSLLPMHTPLHIPVGTLNAFPTRLSSPTTPYGGRNPVSLSERGTGISEENDMGKTSLENRLIPSFDVTLLGASHAMLPPSTPITLASPAIQSNWTSDVSDIEPGDECKFFEDATDDSGECVLQREQ